MFKPRLCSISSIVAAAVGLAVPLEAAEIKIGVIGALSGPIAAYGSEQLAGVRFALEEGKKASSFGSDSVTIVSVDTAGSPGQAAQAAQRLIKSDGVVAIIGGSNSAETQAIYEVIKAAKVPLVSALAQDTILTQEGTKWFARTCPNTDIWASATVKWLMTKPNAKNLYVLARNDGWGRSLTGSMLKSFKDNNVVVVNNIYYEPQTKDFKPILASVKESKAEFVVVNGFYPDVGLLVKHMAEMGITVPYYANTAPSVPQFRDIAGPAAEGAYGTAYYLAGSITSPKGMKFVADWQAQFKREPTQYEGAGYDAMLVVIDSIRRAMAGGSVTHETLQRAIYATKNLEGATGQISILPTGDVQRPLPFYQLRSGKPVLEYLSQ